jgi:hypothetical protein
VAQFVGLLLCVAVTACGGGRGAVTATTDGTLHSQPAALPPGRYIESDGDADKDDDGNRHYSLSLTAKGDDLLSPSDGAKAAPGDTRIIAALVKRYYAAATAEQASQACAMLAPALAEGLAESPPQAGQHGRGCTSAVASFLEREHESFAADDVATMVVVEVQIKGDIATATLGFRTRPIGQIRLKRDNGAWKINGLIDTGYI